MHQVLVFCIVPDRKERNGAPMQHDHDFVVERIGAVQHADEACPVEHARQTGKRPRRRIEHHLLTAIGLPNLGCAAPRGPVIRIGMSRMGRQHKHRYQETIPTSSTHSNQGLAVKNGWIHRLTRARPARQPPVMVVTYLRLLDENSSTWPPTKLTLMERFSSPHRQLRTPITSSHSSGGPISWVTSS